MKVHRAKSILAKNGLNKHISTCMDCRNYLGALMISKKYIAKMP